MQRRSFALSLIITLLCAANGDYRAQNSDTTSPVTAEQFVGVANKYVAAKQYDQAVDAYRNAIKLKPELAAATPICLSSSNDKEQIKDRK